MAKPFFDFKIEGAKELNKVFKSLPKGIGKTQLKSALRKSAKPVVRAAKARAWVKTGAGKKSIKAYTMTKTRVPAAIAIGPGLEQWYMVFQEFGTPFKTAEPFLRPAWDKNKRVVAASFAKNIWISLQRLAKRLTKQAYAGKLSSSGRKALGL